MLTVIYGLHEEGSEEIRYVGKTSALETRLKDHRGMDVSSSNRFFQQWKNSVHATGFLLARVLEESPADWRVAEITWIRRLRREGHRLLNSAPGGNEPRLSGVRSEEHRARISAALMGRPSKLKGIPKSLETRKKMADSARGRHPSLEARAKMGAFQRSKRMPLEARRRISETLKRRYAR